MRGSSPRMTTESAIVAWMGANGSRECAPVGSIRATKLYRAAGMTSGKIAVSEGIETSPKRFTDNRSGAGRMHLSKIVDSGLISRFGLIIASLFLATIVHATEIDSL